MENDQIMDDAPDCQLNVIEEEDTQPCRSQRVQRPTAKLRDPEKNVLSNLCEDIGYFETLFATLNTIPKRYNMSKAAENKIYKVMRRNYYDIKKQLN